MTKKTLKKIGIVFAAILAIDFVTSLATKNLTSNFISSQDEVKTSEIKEKEAEVEKPKTYEVIKIVDGDTIDVKMDGKTTRVRLIGVNTPETVHPEKEVEYFGKEASEYTKKKLTGKKVEIETDDSQDRYDKYGRLLAYVIVDGENLNKSLIEDGYAYEYTYNVPYKYQSEFKAAQKSAETNNKGLWASKKTEAKKEETKKTGVKKTETKKTETKKNTKTTKKTNISKKPTTKKTNSSKKTKNTKKSTNTKKKTNTNKAQKGVCKDGTHVYGNPSARGKANDCYGHGGWRK